MNRIPRRTRRQRRGIITVLTALFMIAFLAMIAFAVDLGYLTTVNTELQRTADAAALAAAWELIDDESLGSPLDLSDELVSARQKASQFAALNSVANAAPQLAVSEAAQSGDVVIGYMADPRDPSATITFGSPNDYNAVKVTVRKASDVNGEVPFFFARALGMTSQAMSADATAALIKNFRGFRAPDGGGNLGVLPFALDLETWNAMLAGDAPDEFIWDEALNTVRAGSDGIREVNLYPQGTGSPGNRGTVDIGPSNNSTSDIARQIVHGVTQQDLDHIGGALKLNDQGTLSLNGDTGISAGVKDELASIIGQPRIIPIFQTVTNPGNNAQYSIVKFAGVRILQVKLTGSMTSKRVLIQPARMVVRGGIPDTTSQSSQYIYSPVWLVR